MFINSCFLGHLVLNCPPDDWLLPWNSLLRILLTACSVPASGFSWLSTLCGQPDSSYIWIYIYIYRNNEVIVWTRVCIYIYVTPYILSRPYILSQPYIQSGAVKLVLWRHGMHVTQVHPVTAEDQFHCTWLYCHNFIYGMTFRPFRALCLEGASCCCLDLYAAMTFKLFQNKNKSCGERV